MLKRSIFGLALLAFGMGSAATAAPVPAETAPFELVQNFVRHIGTFEEDRARAATDQAANKEDFAGCVRNMTTFQMDLDISARYLTGVKLDNSNMAKEIPPMVGAIVRQKYVIVGDLINECEAFIMPDPKVDYTELAKRAPKITVMSDYTDKTLFDASPGIFMTLISPRADSHNHANHLVITREQREKLLNSLQSYFGEKLDMKGDNVNSYVAIAQLFRDKLKEFKCADEPWE